MELHASDVSRKFVEVEDVGVAKEVRMKCDEVVFSAVLLPCLTVTHGWKTRMLRSGVTERNVVHVVGVLKGCKWWTWRCSSSRSTKTFAAESILRSLCFSRLPPCSSLGSPLPRRFPLDRPAVRPSMSLVRERRPRRLDMELLALW